MVCSMLSYMDLPISLWGHALLTIAHILNICPSKSILKTLYEMWKGRKPSFKHIKIWECPAYVNKIKVEKLEAGSLK